MVEFSEIESNSVPVYFDHSCIMVYIHTGLELGFMQDSEDSNYVSIKTQNLFNCLWLVSDLVNYWASE